MGCCGLWWRCLMKMNIEQCHGKHEAMAILTFQPPRIWSHGGGGSPVTSCLVPCVCTCEHEFVWPTFSLRFIEKKQIRGFSNPMRCFRVNGNKQNPFNKFPREWVTTRCLTVRCRHQKMLTAWKFLSAWESIEIKVEPWRLVFANSLCSLLSQRPGAH